MSLGIKMMLESAGLDLDKIQNDFTTLKDAVINKLTEIDRKLAAIEERQILWQKTNQLQLPQPQVPLPAVQNPQPQPQEQPQPTAQ